MGEVVRIGTRGSALALWQAHWVQEQLEQLHVQSVLKIIETSGDRFDAPAQGTGIFVKEIEDQLLNNQIDLAVHSAKDLPTEVPNGLILAAFSQRENPRDVIIFNSKFKNLPDKHKEIPLPLHAHVATGSVRRSSQLLALRPDLKLAPIRGNVQTRLKKLEESFDAIILASAGLKRLNLLDKHLYYELPVSEMIPAVGQGVLALECRADDSVVKKILEKINHQESEQIILSERLFLHALQGGCRAPIACYGAMENGQFILRAAAGLPDGTVLIKKERGGTVTNAQKIAQDLVNDFIGAGVSKILSAARAMETAK